MLPGVKGKLQPSRATATPGQGKISERMTVYSGGRVLDGGADNDEVYSFATFSYLIAGVRWQW